MEPWVTDQSEVDSNPSTRAVEVPMFVLVAVMVLVRVTVLVTVLVKTPVLLPVAVAVCVWVLELVSV